MLVVMRMFGQGSEDGASRSYKLGGAEQQIKQHEVAHQCDSAVM
jgi:hypothetical protein